MTTVKKTLKTLLKTITNPIGQANDEYKKDKKFWTQDLSKRKNEEVELDEMAVGIAKTPSGKKIEWNQIGSKHMVNVNGKPAHSGLIDRIHAAALYTKLCSQDIKEQSNEGIEMNELDEAAKGILHNVNFKYDTYDKDSGKLSTSSGNVKLYAPSKEHAKRYATNDLAHKYTGFKAVRATEIKPTHERVEMGELTPVQRKIRQVIESYAFREDEVEELDEISNKTLGSYIRKASDSGVDARVDMQHDSGSYAAHQSNMKIARKRTKGMDKAINRLTKEEVELEEAFDGTHVVIDKPGHFLHGRKGAVFFRHDDGRINAQVRTGRGMKDNEIHNLTLKPGEFKSVNESVELDEWDAKTMIAAASAASNAKSNKSNKTITRFAPPGAKKDVATLTQVKGKQYTGSDDDEEDEIPSKQEAKRNTVQTSVKKGSNKITVDGEHNIKVGHSTRGHGFPIRSKVIDVSEDGKTLTMDKKSNATGAAEHTFGPGRGRPTGSESGARTHGAEGGIANKAIYGGHQYNMPTFSTSKFSK